MFKRTQLWNLDIRATPDGYLARHVDLRYADAQAAADALRNLAYQIERECGLVDDGTPAARIPLVAVS